MGQETREFLATMAFCVFVGLAFSLPSFLAALR